MSRLPNGGVARSHEPLRHPVNGFDTTTPPSAPPRDPESADTSASDSGAESFPPVETSTLDFWTLIAHSGDPTTNPIDNTDPADYGDTPTTTTLGGRSTRRRHSSAAIPITPRARRTTGPYLRDLTPRSLYVLVLGRGEWLLYLHESAGTGGTLYRIAWMEGSRGNWWVTGHAWCVDAMDMPGLRVAVRIAGLSAWGLGWIREVVEMEDDELEGIEGLDGRVWLGRVCGRLWGRGVIPRGGWEGLVVELAGLEGADGEGEGVRIVESRVCLG